ncbi:MAG: hypothetical protein AB8B56_13050 [Crocinitomicaceae bacterium]
MTIKKGLFFAYTAIILLVSVYVAMSSKDVLSSGNFYKFKSTSCLPFDASQGNFLRVVYEKINIPTKFDFEEGESVCVSIGVDDDGFAFFEEAFKTAPKGQDYIMSTVEWSGVDELLQQEIERAMESDNFNLELLDTRGFVNIKIPDYMNKFFINEDAALRAEKVFRKEQENIHIGVRILDGEVRLEDIYVFEKPILEYLDTKK